MMWRVQAWTDYSADFPARIMDDRIISAPSFKEAVYETEDWLNPVIVSVTRIKPPVEEQS